MTQPALFPAPLAGFDILDDGTADALLGEWGHWLGGCNRPFGRQSLGLWIHGEIVSVAVSASTVNARRGPYARTECVELARLCSHPDRRWATRPMLRLWREIAPACWAAKYWPVIGVVSYSDSTRHSGRIYRFDGWTKWGEVPGGVAGGGWSRGKRYNPKAVWRYPLGE